MLKRLILVFCLIIGADQVAAQGTSLRDRIVSQLREDGYTEIRMSRTLLGRIRFLAIGPPGRREIVVHPATGVVLRDYFKSGNVASGSGNSGSGSGSSSGSGSGGSGYDDDDEDYDDDYDDDEYDDDEDEEEEDDDRDDDEDHEEDDEATESRR